VKEAHSDGGAIGEAVRSAKAYLDHGASLNWRWLGQLRAAAQLYMTLADLFRHRGRDLCLLPLSATFVDTPDDEIIRSEEPADCA
jgi:hypothetical protein